MLSVLVCEDDPLVLKELALLTPWQSLGLSLAATAETGSEALRLYERLLPNIILTDVRMPEIDGLELIRRIREREGQERADCLILSGYSDFEYARSAIRLGVSEYLLKPVDEDELLAALKRSALRFGMTKSYTGFVPYGLNGLSQPALPLALRAAELIHSRYISGISIDEAASMLGVSAGYLSRVCKRAFGMSFGEYLSRFRVERAAALLIESDAKIYEIADLVGYEDARWFIRLFRRFTGYTPSTFRRLRPAPPPER